MRRIAIILFVGIVAGNVDASLADSAAVDPTLFQAKEFRFIGPRRAGRASAVVGVPGEPFRFLMGTSGGGVWETTDAGTHWQNLSDDDFAAASIGAIAVSPSEPSTIYVGTGEACIRGNVQTGVGVYKSSDGGESWQHSGLSRSRHISRIRVHPHNPETVYVAVLGNVFAPGRDRGVYRSTDGGKSWQQSLFVSEHAGAVDLAIDPNDPDVLYAAIYQVSRSPWSLVSGGEDSGLYKTYDGGKHWQKLGGGLPEGVVGRIGVTVSPTDSAIVYVNIEAPDAGGVYRSDDSGRTFQQVSDDGRTTTRPFYYTHIFAHPRERESVFVLNMDFLKSVDGGKSYDVLNELIHYDFHDLWVNPDNPEIMIIGTDAGGRVSLNSGKTWSTERNQPTGEIYRVTTDNRYPYRVYGSQQDDWSMSVPSMSFGKRVVEDVYMVGGGEHGHIAVHPENPDIVYAGNYEGIIHRYDHSQGDLRNIEVYPQLAEGVPAIELKYRFQMNAPIRVSVHDPNIIYQVSQYVHRSDNEGQSWQVVSPDLTRNDKSKQGFSGGPITKDHTGVETYNTIFAFEESAHRQGLLWAGSDDGLMHISRDNGENWQNITPPEIPEWGTVNMIELSAHSPGRAFIVVHRYRLGDFSPYLFRTDDFGETWTQLGTTGIAADHFARVIREDPERQGLLYLGTEFGLYVSFDDGEHWQDFRQNLPVVQIADMVIKEQDLVIATHGRGFWIMDDISQMRSVGNSNLETQHFLYSSENPYRRVEMLDGRNPLIGPTEFGRKDWSDLTGLSIYYHLVEVTGETAVLEIMESDGSPVRAFSSAAGDLTTKAGMNHFFWDLRYPAAEQIGDQLLRSGNVGPQARPGEYQMRLTVGDWSMTRAFEVLQDPRNSVPAADLDKQFAMAIEVRDAISALNRDVSRIRYLRRRLQATGTRLEEHIAIAAKADDLDARLHTLEATLVQDGVSNPLEASILMPALEGQLAQVLNVLLAAEHRPTDGAVNRFADLKVEVQEYRDQLHELITLDIQKLNDLLLEIGEPLIRHP